jgi:hypothetical protein
MIVMINPETISSRVDILINCDPRRTLSPTAFDLADQMLVKAAEIAVSS